MRFYSQRRVDADVDLYSSGGGYVKNCSPIAVEFACGEKSSAKTPRTPKFSLNKKFLFFTALALSLCASLDFSRSAKAEATFTVASIRSALGGEPQAATPQPYANDDAVSALRNFTQQIDAGNSNPAGAAAVNSDRRFDDQAFAALRDFTQRLGTAQPESIKALPKLAEADNILDMLRGNNGATPAPATPKASKAATPKWHKAPVDATFVGAKTCLTCHSSQAAAFEKTLMGRIGKTQKGKFDCENCHGPGSAHVNAGGGRGVGGIISFRPEDPARSAEENNAVCLTCHEKGDRTYWNGSTHETRGLMCTNCHTVMKEVSRKRQLKTVVEAETCFQCHKDRRAEMARSSHMPLREGKITCSDCHNPHGSATDGLLRETSINATCYKCHAEKRGPFLFEHAPVRENCANCHDPHGSVNEFMLKVSRPKLCFECHGFGHGGTAGPAQVQSIGRSCQNCHNAVHGTNSPQPLLHK
jgi:DmsE family decaheme c-type cytochrome